MAHPKDLAKRRQDFVMFAGPIVKKGTRVFIKALGIIDPRHLSTRLYGCFGDIQQPWAWAGEIVIRGQNGRYHSMAGADFVNAGLNRSQVKALALNPLKDHCDYAIFHIIAMMFL
jgi:hypothetical protein